MIKLFLLPHVKDLGHRIKSTLEGVVLNPADKIAAENIKKLLTVSTILSIFSQILPNFGGFHRTLQRVRLANSGLLLLRTAGPVPGIYGLAFVCVLWL